MKRKLPGLLLCTFLLITQAFAQQKVVKGKVTSAEDGLPLPNASVKIQGTSTGVQTGTDGTYTIKADAGQVLLFSFIGTVPEKRTVLATGTTVTFNVSLKADSKALKEVTIVGALGIKTAQRALGSAVTAVKGEDLSQTQRENFVNALSGRVAGVDVSSASGMPGSSSSITIRGVSSISGNNQPLFIVDGLPVDNTTFNTNNLYGLPFSNSNVDFTNRIADINPEDIESLTVLKGPEAAALYGIDAANGAIVITTKRGKAGSGSISYSNSFRIDKINKYPEVQKIYGIGYNGFEDNSTLRYFGPKYPDGTQFYDNIKSFFQTAFTQKHNLSFEGGSDKTSYRISSGYVDQGGVIPNSGLTRINLSGATTSKLNNWLSLDASLNYSYSNNISTFKGEGGPLLGLLTWPMTDNAADYLNSNGSRRYLNYTSEVENPFFNVNKNTITSKTNRIFSNSTLNINFTPWIKNTTSVGFDVYSTKSQIVRHPESGYGLSKGGVIDVSNTVQRNLNLLSYFSIDRKISSKFNASLKFGGALQDNSYDVTSVYGEGFLEPNFISPNNVDPTKQRVKATLTQKRMVGLFGDLSFDYDRMLYLKLTGRNDWSSTLPVESNSFFYPSASLSFIFTELAPFKKLDNIISFGKLRASVAQVGRDARPYSIAPSLEVKPTSGGGFGYGFTGPNPNLVPEKATSYEFGTEMKFLKNRLGFTFTYYDKRTDNQIVSDLRGSYGTGFILLTLNGGKTANHGYEIELNGTPIQRKNFSWDVAANFNLTRSKLVTLPRDLPETYNSDTWLYKNVRNGMKPGMSLTSMTGYFYLRNNNGDILIDPTTGLPITSSVNNEFIPINADRRPDFTVGLVNTFTYKNFSLNFLLEFRKGGDVFNATEHYITSKGLSTKTLDREMPRIVSGVLRDGNENTANPTKNTIQINPYYRSIYYAGISEEAFIERNINYVRMRDITLSYKLPASLLKKQGFLKSASVFVTATDVFMITNYTGLDPVSNGNSAATTGTGSFGFDYGNFPVPTGINFGVRIGL